jgi:hypothetical protein
MDAYFDAAGIMDEKRGPLFCSLDKHRHLTVNPMTRTDVLLMIKAAPWPRSSQLRPVATPSGPLASPPTLKTAARSRTRRRSRHTSRQGRRSSTTARATRSPWTKWSGFRFETGETTLLRMIAWDIAHGAGIAVDDPCGSLVAEILEAIPRHRANDVVYLNPTGMFRLGICLIRVLRNSRRSLRVLEGQHTSLEGNWNSHPGK